MYHALSALRRYALPLAGIVLALVCIATGTHDLAAHVLPFDWSTASADVAPAPVTVQLP